jgi:hypothetical protein
VSDACSASKPRSKVILASRFQAFRKAFAIEVRFFSHNTARGKERSELFDGAMNNGFYAL